MVKCTIVYTRNTLRYSNTFKGITIVEGKIAYACNTTSYFYLLEHITIYSTCITCATHHTI